MDIIDKARTPRLKSNDVGTPYQPTSQLSNNISDIVYTAAVHMFNKIIVLSTETA